MWYQEEEIRRDLVSVGSAGRIGEMSNVCVCVLFLCVLFLCVCLCVFLYFCTVCTCAKNNQFKLCISVKENRAFETVSENGSYNIYKGILLD